MYNYIKGIITEVTSSYIVIENQNIGYQINVGNPYIYKENESYTIYIYNHIREDEHTLFGFRSKEERNLFLKLISVKGVGCKMALPMLATGSTEGIIDAIDRENILYLKKFPKIGDKVARQIILDLKGKLAKSDEVNTQVSDELVEALKSLGYKQADINKVVKKIDSNIDIEIQIKEALKLLLK